MKTKQRKTAATIEDSLKSFSEGALTLEGWRRQQQDPKHDVHVVLHHPRTQGVDS